MNAAKWIKIWAFFVIFFIATVGVLNFTLDPQYVFKDYKLYRGQLDVRFPKVNYLKENNTRYNSYMMGSSRIGTTSPKSIEVHMKNKEFYNFWIGGANLDDILIHLEYFLENKYKFESLYIQIGLHNMEFIDHDIRAHPEVQGSSLYLFYIKKLFSFSLDSILLKFFPNEVNNNLVEMPIKDGVFKFVNRDLLIEENHDEYVIMEQSFKTYPDRTIHFTTRQKLEGVLSKINLLCRKHNIKLIMFITPHHKSVMDSFVIDDYFEFLKTLSIHNNFYDFSGYNSVTINDYNYYESSHYLSKVGDLIAARIFEDKNFLIPDDFGRLVTKKNIDSYLYNKRANIHKYELTKHH